MQTFIHELRRRRVIRSATYYLGVAWVIIGACDIFFPIFGIPDAALRITIFALLAGIPIVLVLSWFYEFSPSGIKAESDTASAAQPTQRNPFDLLLIALLGGALTVSVVVNLRDGNLFENPVSVPMVAVLPFQDFSEAGEHISVGLAEELLNLLVREPNIRVMSSAMSFNLSNNEANLLRAAQDIEADFIVRGSLTQQTDQFRVLVRLIDVISGEVVWSDDFLGPLGEIFAAQREVAGHVASSLNVAIEYAFSSSEGILNPQAVDLFLQAKAQLRNSGSLEAVRSAQAMLQKAMVQQPDFSAGLGELCRAYLREFARTEDPEDFKQADTQCREALQADAESPHTQLALAVLLNNAGQPQQALDIVAPLVQRLPNFEAAYNQLGQAHWQLGNLAAAAQTFEQAAAIHDQNWQPHLSLGNFYARTQQYEAAIAPFTRITELLPDDFIGYASLGVTLYESGEYARAKALIEKSLSLNENSRAYFNLGLINTGLEDHAAAAEAFSKAVELNPQNYRAQMFVSTSLANQGDAAGAQTAAQNALQIIRELVELNPKATAVIAHGATIMAEYGDTSEALQWAERARRQNQGNPKVQFNIATTYYQTGDTERALAEYRTSLELGYPIELFKISEVPEAVLTHPSITPLLEVQKIEKQKDSTERTEL